MSSCAFSPEARSQQQPAVNSPDPHLFKNRPFGKDCHILCWSFLSTPTVPQHVCFQTQLPLTPDTLYPACSKAFYKLQKSVSLFLLCPLLPLSGSDCFKGLVNFCLISLKEQPKKKKGHQFTQSSHVS